MSRTPAATAESRWIDLVLERAGALREAGVLSIGPGSASFSPFEPKYPDSEKKPPEAEQTGDAYAEAARTALGVDPGFTITKLKDGDEW